MLGVTNRIERNGMCLKLKTAVWILPVSNLAKFSIIIHAVCRYNYADKTVKFIITEISLRV